MIILNDNGFTNLHLEFVNYFLTNAENLDGSKVPMMLKISGLLNGINTNTSQKLLIFIENLDYLYTETDQDFSVVSSNSQTIGCSSNMEGLICYKRNNLSDGGYCGVATRCKNYLFYNYLTVHLPNTVFS